MEEGYVKAQSDNLPRIDSMMVAEYFATSDNYFAAELRGVKERRAARENYGYASVGYVQLKRSGSHCIVKCKICPEHKVRSKNYNVSLKIDEKEERIVRVMCHDCAASTGGCKHPIAFLVWVHRRSEEAAPTDVTCYWKKSKLSGIGTSLKYITVKDFGTVQNKDATPSSNSNFLNWFVQKGLERNVSSQIIKHFSKPSSVEQLSVHYLLRTFATNGGKKCDDFLLFAKQQMSLIDCEEACKLTAAQRESSLWFNLRYGRITASKIYEAARCRKVAGTFVEGVIGASKLRETEAMKREKNLEKQVLEVLEKQEEKDCTNVGLLLSNKHPILGASPDALMGDIVVEIKCPSKTIENYIKNDKITNKCNAQIQLQLHLFNKKKRYFV